MTDPRRDVAERLEKQLLHIGVALGAEHGQTAPRPAYEMALDKVRVALLRSEGEPVLRGVLVACPRCEMSRGVYYRSVVPSSQYGCRDCGITFGPPLGTPSDSQREDWSGIADVGTVASRASDSPCRIIEHDGAAKCYAHDRLWGAVTNPDEPCASDSPKREDGEPWVTEDDVTFLRSLAEYHRRDSDVAAEAIELDELADRIDRALATGGDDE